MKILSIISALIAGASLAWIKVRHTGSISKAIISMDLRWLSDKVDKVDKLLLIIAGTFIVVFLVATVLSF
jgi:acetone carboxylase gamma subunit